MFLRPSSAHLIHPRGPISSTPPPPQSAAPAALEEHPRGRRRDGRRQRAPAVRGQQRRGEERLRVDRRRRHACFERGGGWAEPKRRERDSIGCRSARALLLASLRHVLPSPALSCPLLTCHIPSSLHGRAPLHQPPPPPRQRPLTVQRPHHHLDDADMAARQRAVHDLGCARFVFLLEGVREMVGKSARVDGGGGADKREGAKGARG